MDYEYYGLRLRAPFRCQFLAPAPASAAPPDVVLTEGEVATLSPQTIWASPFVSVEASGAVPICVDAIAKFRIEQGSIITLQANAGARFNEIEALLLGPVAGVVLHQRSLFPLQASYVKLRGKALALAGPGGAGKSTLIAALMRSGAEFLGDGICRLAASQCSAVWASPPVLRLWQEARDSLAWPGAWNPVRAGSGLGLCQVDGPRANAVTPLGAIVRVESANVRQPIVERSKGPSSLLPQSETVYQYQLARMLGRTQSLLQGIMSVVSSVPVFAMQRPRHIDSLEQTKDLLLSAVGECW